MRIINESFLKVISDKTSKFTKIHKSKFLTEGEYPIVDQGQEYIAGYTNNKEDINYLGEPVIIFGDHTRILKYVDFPFAIGADGVKVLHVNKDKLNPLFTYYYLKSLDIPSAGYSRHFKFIKNKKLNFPESVKDQKRIAQVLSNCETLIQKRRESIALLDELLKSTFLEMFGDIRAKKSIHKWEKLRPYLKAQSGKSSKLVKSNQKTDFPIYGGNGINGWANKSLYNEPIIIAGRVGQHCGSIHIVRKPCWVTDNAIVLSILNNSKLNITYLASALSNSPIIEKVKQLDLPFINQSMLLDINVPIPPIQLQNKFATIVERVEEIKQHYQTHLQELENLYGSISQKAFKGELDLSKVIVPEAINISGTIKVKPSVTATLTVKPILSKKELAKIVKSKTKRDITNMTYLDFIGMPTDLQMKNYASDYSIETDFVDEKLFAQFYLKDNFKNKEFTLGDVEAKFNSYFIPKGQDFDYEIWKGFVFNFIEAKPPLLKQIFDKTDNTIKLELTDEAFKA